MPSIAFYPVFKAFDANGTPLASGTVDFYQPGTTTHKNTWDDADKTTATAAQQTLDSNGELEVWLEGKYRIVLKDSLGNTIWDIDNVDSGVWATGTHTFSTVTADTGGTDNHAETNASTGLATDDIDFGGSVKFASVKDGAFHITDANGYMVTVFQTDTETTGTATPSTGQIQLYVVNGDSSTQNITVNWWARPRS